MSKYAPANEDGDKPYVVSVWNFGREVTRVVYASNTNNAKYAAIGRQRSPMAYVRSCRRATPADIPARVQGVPEPQGE